MRCSGWSSLAISACSVVVLAGSASAHVVATPTFLASGSSESIVLSAPNERDAPVTAFSITAPDGLEIEHAHELAGWEASMNGTSATWTGGRLAPDVTLAFGVDLEADREPGVVELQAEQRYADGAVVRWPVTLTVTPAEDAPSQNLALAGAIGLVGVLAVVGIVLLARRRSST